MPYVLLAQLPLLRRYWWDVYVAYTGPGADGAMLITPGSATHQLNMNQRAIRLATAPGPPFWDGKPTLRVTMPPTFTVAPPG